MSGHVGSLGDKYRFKFANAEIRSPPSPMRFVGDNSAKFKFELAVLTLPPTFKENMDCSPLLTIAYKATAQAL